MMNITLLTLMCFQYLNTPYRWGSNGPNSFDCSGLVLKVLNDVGVLLPDMTAQNLYDYLINHSHQMSNPSHDVILFFGKDTQNITHVAIAINDKYMIEAGGAGRNSVKMSVEELAKIDARVRVKPISIRKDLAAAIKLNY